MAAAAAQGQNHQAFGSPVDVSDGAPLPPNLARLRASAPAMAAGASASPSAMPRPSNALRSSLPAGLLRGVGAMSRGAGGAAARSGASARSRPGALRASLPLPAVSEGLASLGGEDDFEDGLILRVGSSPSPPRSRARGRSPPRAVRPFSSTTTPDWTPQATLAAPRSALSEEEEEVRQLQQQEGPQTQRKRWAWGRARREVVPNPGPLEAGVGTVRRKAGPWARLFCARPVTESFAG